jgi:CRP/FNR family cyclic AMP-dependent transcriptional regulator
MLLKGSALARGLSDPDLAAMAAEMDDVRLDAGARVIQAGATDDTVFLIVGGTVRISVCHPGGLDVVIAMLGPGDVVGELSALDSAGRSADVVAMEATHLLALSHEALDRFLVGIPTLTHNLLRLLARRVRLSTEQIQALCALDALGKVARQLLVFADQYGESGPDGQVIPMRLTQSDLGGMVGVSRERVNQVVGVLRRKRLVSVGPDYRVTVHDADKLRQLVESR